METTKDSILKIVKNGELKAVVIRDEKTRHQVFYLLEEVGQEELLTLLN